MCIIIVHNIIIEPHSCPHVLNKALSVWAFVLQSISIWGAPNQLTHSKTSSDVKLKFQTPPPPRFVYRSTYTSNATITCHVSCVLTFGATNKAFYYFSAPKRSHNGGGCLSVDAQHMANSVCQLMQGRRRRRPYAIDPFFLLCPFSRTTTLVSPFAALLQKGSRDTRKEMRSEKTGTKWKTLNHKSLFLACGRRPQAQQQIGKQKGCGGFRE